MQLKGEKKHAVAFMQSRSSFCLSAAGESARVRVFFSLDILVLDSKKWREVERFSFRIQ